MKSNKTAKTEKPANVQTNNVSKLVKDIETALKSMPTNLMSLLTALSSVVKERLMGLSQMLHQPSLKRKEAFIIDGYFTVLNEKHQEFNAINLFDLSKMSAFLKGVQDLVKEIDAEYPDLAKFAAEYKVELEKKKQAMQQIGHEGVPIAMNDGSGCKGDCGGCGSH